jgi:hypothetical protein
MKIYIYTIPKAGTYLLAELVTRLGFVNTGFHVNRDRYLDTLSLDPETNARFPSRAMKKQDFLRTLGDMQPGELAFGHFPVPMMGWLLPDFVFVCAYRHPRQTLVAEFIDFRFRRQDVRWVAPAAIPDDRAAFREYLRRHGEGHMAIFSQMLGLTLLLKEPLCSRFQEGQRFHLVAFDRLRGDPAEAERLARFLRVDPARARAAHAQALAAETKTKATGLAIDRAALWSDEAEAYYAALDAEAYVRRGRELGWDI